MKKVYPCVKLETVIENIRYGTGTPPCYLPHSNTTVPFVRATEIKDGTIKLDSILHISRNQPAHMEKCRLSGGEIIIVRSGANTGDCAVIPKSLANAFAAYDLILNLNDKALAEFVATFLDSSLGRLQLNLVKGRAAQPHINANEVLSIEIPLPPLKKQERLVADIEAANDRRAAKLREADALLADMDGVVLARLGIGEIEVTPRIAVAVTLGTLKADNTLGAAYYHPERLAVIRALENDANVTTRKLDDIADFMRDTVSPADSGKPYLGLAGVMSNTGELSGAEEEAEGQAFAYNAGDVLYGRLRPYLNKVLCAEADGVCSTEFHVMRVKTADVLPEYLAAIMRSKIIVAQTRHMMTGNTHPRISNDDVKNLRVPVPDEPTQTAIVAELRAKRDRALALKREAETEWAAAKARFEEELLK